MGQLGEKSKCRINSIHRQRRQYFVVSYSLAHMTHLIVSLKSESCFNPLLQSATNSALILRAILYNPHDKSLSSTWIKVDWINRDQCEEPAAAAAEALHGGQQHSYTGHFVIEK